MTTERSRWIGERSDGSEGSNDAVNSRLHILRISLAAVAVSISIPILICSGKSLHDYSRTTSYEETLPTGSDGSGFIVQFWPGNMRTEGIWGLCAAGIVSTVAGLVVLTYSLLFRSRSNEIHQSLAAILAGIFSTSSTTPAIAIFYTQDADPMSHTLKSWTCSLKDVVHTPPFHTICGENQATIGMSIAILAIEVGFIIAGILGIWGQLRKNRTRNSYASHKLSVISSNPSPQPRGSQAQWPKSALKPSPSPAASLKPLWSRGSLDAGAGPRENEYQEPDIRVASYYEYY